MLLHPSQFDTFTKGCEIITSEDYDLICKSIEEGLFGDIEKAKKDLSHLVKVTTPIIRNGKVVMQTMYINPKKTNEEDLKKTYRNTPNPAEPRTEDSERVVVESNVFKRGDLVKLKLQDGTETVGQFRDFVIKNEETGQRKALIRAQIKDRKTGELKSKTIERNAEDIVLVNEPKKTTEEETVIRRFNPEDLKIGDSVKITLRQKEEGNPAVTMKEVDAVLVRKVPKGFEAYLPNGEVVIRPVSTLRKTGEGTGSLTEEQEVILNKAIKAIKMAIKDKVNIIDIVEKRKPSGYQNTVERLQGEIENDKSMQYNYYQIYKGNLKFEDIIQTEK